MSNTGEAPPNWRGQDIDARSAFGQGKGELLQAVRGQRSVHAALTADTECLFTRFSAPPSDRFLVRYPDPSAPSLGHG